MKNKERVEIETPDKGCDGVKRCSECSRPICQRQFAKRGGITKPVKEMTGIPLNPYAMHDLFTNG